MISSPNSATSESRPQREIEDIYPLTSLQQGMLFHSLYAPRAVAYAMQNTWTLEGELEVEAFRQAWQGVIDRHTILRTRFVWERRDQPLQVVLRRAELPWDFQDWRGLDKDDQQERLAAYVAADLARGFDLSQAPLMRIALIRTAETSYRFIWSHHHILLDGWCVALVLQDFLALYEAACTGLPAELPPARPFREYVLWLQRQNHTEAEAFWRDYLRGFHTPTTLPIDRAPGSLPSEHPTYDDQHIRLDAATSAALQALARQHEVTLSTLVQGVWALLLSRYSSERDVLFGITTAGRPADLPGVETMVGLFINTLPLRVRVAPAEPIGPWLKRLQSQQLDVRQYEYSSLADVQGWSEVPRGTGLFESILVFQNFPLDSAIASFQKRLAIGAVEGVERTNYPLTLVAQPGAEMGFSLAYDTARFEHEAITRLLEHLRTLLRAIAEQPELPVGRLPLLTEAERQDLLVERNATARAYPKDRCYHDLVADQAARTPEAVAVRCLDRELSYAELDERANRLANFLRAAGVRTGDCVGLCMERSLEMAVALLGILKAGAAFLPLDPSFPPERMEFMLRDTKAALLLTQAHLGLPQELLPSRLVALDAAWEEIAALPAIAPVTGVTGEHLMYVIYTSGSTGRPKGVMIPHFGLVNYLDWCLDAYTAREGRGAPVQSSIAADAIFPSLFAPLMVGKMVLMLPGAEAFAGLQALTDALLHQGPFGQVKITPTQLEVVNQQLPTDGPRDWVRTLIVGAEALRGDTIHFWQEHVPHTILLNEYGPTETVVGCSIYRIPPGVMLTGAVPIGLPIANIQFYVLDAMLQPVPVGVPGELFIGGDGVAWGYLNRADLTAKAFVPDPFSPVPGARLYKTGDLVKYLPDPEANIEFLGRIDDQVKIRGYRVELGEVEATLVEHPAVREVVVLAREERPGQRRLVAYVVAEPGEEGPDAPAPLDDVREFARARLPDYMVPEAFVFLPALPLTPHGKLNRQALPAPDRASLTSNQEALAPRTPVEQQLVQIWQELLNVSPISIIDDFFDLGGNSFLAMRLASWIQQTLGTDVALATIFEARTISRLTEALDATSYPGVLHHFDALRDSNDPLVALKRSGTRAPFFFVAPLGGILPSTVLVGLIDLAQTMHPEQPFYGLQLPPMAQAIAHELRRDEHMTDAQIETLLRELPHGQQLIREAAARCVKAITKTQRVGPYMLGGFCSGSIVTYEVATMLREQGHEVSLLVLIDVHAPGYTLDQETSEALDEPFVFQQAWFITRDLAGREGARLPAPIDLYHQLRAMGEAERWEHARELLVGVGVLPANTATQEIHRLFQIYLTNLRSLNHIFTGYDPVGFDGPIHLFSVEEEVVQAPDRTLGWSRLAGGGVVTHTVPGDHGTLFLPENIRTMAETMETLLAGVQGARVATGKSDER
ncbi:MAG TPA: amino acid adenylation domain-containing protein [Roseiflexaceae bacterium]|nr:amino acid adenylation domain-containing protein [Roseiflexaceae bacterium]